MSEYFSNVNTFVDTSNNSLFSQSFTSLSHVCGRCGSHDFEEILEPSSSRQFAKIVCAKCGKFKSWQRDPSITELHNERKIKIEKLIDTGRATNWEISFLRNIRRSRILTVKQANKFRQVCDRLLPDTESKASEYDDIISWLWEAPE
ncbi:MAG: hypothetical protein KME22_07700 [Hassallia sp. WJT32-NPBG1]|jgi:predicted RNA-binding Zn-ribbon protein involved in translation (DUF1610 family)|nr:hypothetical protein [Hassallia sp. WJT32-NPBG1]